VIFNDGRMADASVIGADPDSDLAVLGIDVPAEYLQPVTLADSMQLKVGDLAIAIGNPFGQEGTMTTGIVSALGRLLPVESNTLGASQYNIPDVIQTDAAINPGNSGGVLLNDQGDVVGVTSAIISAVRSSSGVGFAIPSSIVQEVVPALITDGHFDHPYIGISGTSLTPDLAEAMNLASDQRGALVILVMPDSPAALAGLMGSDQQAEIDGEQVQVGGDVITAVNEQPVQRIDDLIAYLYRNGQVGNDLSIKILRDGSEQTLTVTLQARPQAESQPASQSTANDNNESRAYMGITGIDVTSDLAVLMGLRPDQDGVMVQQVQSGSPADLAGLQGSTRPATINGEQALIGGDLIIAANGEAIHNFDDLRSFVDQGAPGDQVHLTILRDGSEQEILLTLGELSN
ncbi:MAG: PDZ domain-containing protein, partial [Candidatus Promineifilaceae bacterium]